MSRACMPIFKGQTLKKKQLLLFPELKAMVTMRLAEAAHEYEHASESMVRGRSCLYFMFGQDLHS